MRSITTILAFDRTEDQLKVFPRSRRDLI